MIALLRFTWDILLFKHEAYVQHVARTDALKRGLLLLVVVSLLAGSIPFLIDFIGGLRPLDPVQQRREFDQQMAEFFATMRQYGDLPPDFEEQFMLYLRPSVEIGFRVAALPTPLPRPLGTILGNVFQALGAFLSLPFQRLGGWLSYGIWVLLVAKLLGGRGTLSQLLGATVLYAIPHVLGVFSFIPCLGGLLVLIATVWGIAIYIKALAVAGEFELWKAVLAAVLPACIVILLLFFGLLVFGIIAAAGQ
ncbi:MAG: YIP1 family protein [Anaerolineae bacterium]|nr:YIP1 family protein [Anaerolineae bacterium]